MWGNCCGGVKQSEEGQWPCPAWTLMARGMLGPSGEGVPAFMASSCGFPLSGERRELGETNRKVLQVLSYSLSPPHEAGRKLVLLDLGAGPVLMECGFRRVLTAQEIPKRHRDKMGAQ